MKLEIDLDDKTVAALALEAASVGEPSLAAWAALCLEAYTVLDILERREPLRKMFGDLDEQTIDGLRGRYAGIDELLMRARARR